MAEDRVAAYLAGVRERAGLVRKTERSREPGTPRALDVARRNSARDVTPLLAAVEAVRDLADGWDIQAIRIADEIEQVSPRNVGARVLLEVRSELRKICAEAARSAISAALLGEEKADG